jgi:hypothetical protein
MTTTNDSPLSLISEVTEFNDLSEFMQDPDLDEALHLLLKIIARPDIPPVKAQAIIIKLQAISAKFQMMSTIYTTILKGKAGTDEYTKKNVYFKGAY